MCRQENEKATVQQTAATTTESCTCPFCNREVVLENGIKPEQLLAANLLQILGAEQREKWDGATTRCMCCGMNAMRVALTQNHLSKQAEIFICHECAAREENGNGLPIDAWYVIKEICGF